MDTTLRAIIVLSGLGIWLLPDLLLISSPRLSGKDLANKSPKLARVRWWIPAINTSYLLLGLLIMKVLPPSVGEHSIYIFGMFFALLGVINGLLAVSTNVYRVGTKYNNGYVYDGKVRRIGYLHTIIGYVYIAAIGLLSLKYH